RRRACPPAAASGYSKDVEQETLASRKRWAGRLAAVFYLASGVLSLATLPLSSSDANLVGLATVSITALVVGVGAWAVDWGRRPRGSSLWLVPPGLLLIAAGNAYGGSGYFTYGVFFLLVFVWIGFAHAPGTSLLFALPAAAAYVVPLLSLPPDDLRAGLGSAAVVLPLCVLVGEALSRGTERTLRIEAALQRERELRERQQKLEAMKSTFLRAASHELRTPITICRGHLDVLDPRTGSDEVARTLRLVVDELSRMGRLVEDITTLTRLEDPDGLALETFAAADLLREVSAKAEPLLDGRLSVEGAADGRITADRHRLHQALLGLISNAANHAGPSATVTLRSVRETAGWRFEVADDGVGIGDLDRGALFQPFMHGPDSDGTGLGLALVERIARAHGGETGIEEPSPGATFWIRIPA
ncbi:MAG TPA: HAMP domain-containing sensor histidine kinase, partial [Actinomycetota bacterium]|nr:HAMP domain-containing sensor histidine kinase [Actinomycetota bacterium]